MVCVKIEWKGAFNCGHPEDLPVIRQPVIYAIYKVTQVWFDETKELLYIGQSQKCDERLWGEIEGFGRGMSDEEIKQRIVHIGVISSFDDPNITVTPEQLTNIEAFFIRKYKPLRNKKVIKDKPKHIPLLVVNTGQDLFDPVISHNPELLEILKKGLSNKSLLDL